MMILIRYVAVLFAVCSFLTNFPSQGLCEVPFQINARAGALFEFGTGQFLLEQNADERIEPASFTKLMTLFLAEDGLKNGTISLDDEVLVSAKAWKTGGSKMFIEVGKRVLLGDLLKGIAVVSGNDACVALAEHMTGKEEVFAEEMNRKVQQLGLRDTAFKNPHGLPAEGQYTTAHDMVLLAYHYLKEYPQTLDLHSMLEFTYGEITQPNRNRLLSMDVGVDGFKTGHVESAGYHLLATAEREGRRLIAVVMGAESWKDRESEALNLLNFGFRNYVIKEVVKEGETWQSVPVKGGKFKTVELVTQRGVSVSIVRNESGLLGIEERVSSHVRAPVKKGEVLGKVLVKMKDQTLQEVNLLAKDEVPKGWQAYWRFGIALLVILGLAILLQRIAKRRKAIKGYSFQDDQ